MGNLIFRFDEHGKDGIYGKGGVTYKFINCYDDYFFFRWT